VRSLPMIVSVEFDPLSPGAMLLSVTTPSISTVVVPLTTTAMTTRMNSSGEPPVNRNRICSGDCLSTLNVSLNPLWPTSTTFTSTSVSASITARGGVSGMNGPINRRSSTLSSIRLSDIRRPRHAQRRRDVQHLAGGGHEIVGVDRAVGIADQPEDQRVAEVLRGDQIEAIALPYRVLRDGGEIGRAGMRRDPPRHG